MSEDIKKIKIVEKYNNKQYLVEFESNEKIFLDYETIFLNNIRPGNELSLSDIENILKDDDYIRCKRYAFNLVSKFSKTKKEIQDKLASKGYDSFNIKKVIDLLIEYDLINDNKYAASYIKSKLLKESKNKISYELSLKGISKDIIESIFYDLQTEDETILEDSLMKIAEKKYKELLSKERDDFKIREKLYSFLLRKGFKWDEIKSCLDLLLKEEFS